MSTQTSYPGQATKRTLASLITALPFAVGALVALSEIIKVINDSFGAHLPDAFQSNSVLIATVCIAIATALTRIMAIPAVNMLLTKIGLGAEPKQAVKEMEEILETQTEAYVLPLQPGEVKQEVINSENPLILLKNEEVIEVTEWSPLSEEELKGRG